MLSRHPAIEFLGEVFHPRNVGEYECYFEFEKANQRSYEELVFERVEIFRRYLEDLRRRYADKEIVFIDAKYNSTHHLRPPWSSPADPPHLIQFARDEGWPIVHLTRRNLLQVFVSGKLADLNQVWHLREGTELKHTSLDVDIAELRGFLHTCKVEHKRVVDALMGHPYLMEIDYTQLFDHEGALTAEVAERLGELLTVEPFAERSTEFIKQVKAPLSSTIRNFESVRESLVDTEYSWMLEQ